MLSRGAQTSTHSGGREASAQREDTPSHQPVAETQSCLMVNHALPFSSLPAPRACQQKEMQSPRRVGVGFYFCVIKFRAHLTQKPLFHMLSPKLKMTNPETIPTTISIPWWSPLGALQE